MHYLYKDIIAKYYNMEYYYLLIYNKLEESRSNRLTSLNRIALLHYLFQQIGWFIADVTSVFCVLYCRTGRTVQNTR